MTLRTPRGREGREKVAVSSTVASWLVDAESQLRQVCGAKPLGGTGEENRRPAGPNTDPWFLPCHSSGSPWGTAGEKGATSTGVPLPIAAAAVLGPWLTPPSLPAPFDSLAEWRRKLTSRVLPGDRLPTALVPSLSALLAASLAHFSRLKSANDGGGEEAFPGEDFAVPAGVDAWHRCGDADGDRDESGGVRSDAARVATGAGKVVVCDCAWPGAEGETAPIAACVGRTGVAVDFTDANAAAGIVGCPVGPVGPRGAQSGDATGDRNAGNIIDATLPAWVRHDPECQSIASLCAVLRALGLAPEVESSAFSCAHRVIDAAVEEACGSVFDEHFLTPLCEWASSTVGDWLAAVLCPSAPSPRGVPVTSGDGYVSRWTASACARIAAARARQSFARLRIGELFDIIVDFPDSQPAIEDLARAMQRVTTGQAGGGGNDSSFFGGHGGGGGVNDTGVNDQGERTDEPLKRELVASLSAALSRRLLHPGADTSDIIDQYVNSIHALRLLDPSGVVLEIVGDPVRRYLRRRQDTVRCIVTALTDDSGDGPGLYRHLGDRETNLDPGDDSDSDEDAEAWCPDPADADPTRPSRTRRTTDVITMLVNIYGSRELFVAEYRHMLAERLLSQCNYDADREVRALELLKLRFGEASLGQCEIMVRDIADSKRVNTNIHSVIRRETPVGDMGIDGSGHDDPARKEGEGGGGGGEGPDGTGVRIDALILSRLFWPSALMEPETLNLPERVAKHARDYERHYEQLRGSRKLTWLPQHGTVELELSFEIPGRPGEMSEPVTHSVNPVQAAAIDLFTERESWPASELADRLGVDKAVLRRKIGYWLVRGIIAEDPSIAGYRLCKEAASMPDGAASAAASVAIEEEVGGSTSAAQAALEAEMGMYEQFVFGMLTNFGTAPLDKLHNMMSVVVDEYDKSMQDLGEFLRSLCRDGKLEFDGSEYSIKKS